MSPSGRPTQPVVVLASPCAATNIVVHALEAAGIEVTLVVERPVSRWTLVKRRAKRLGVVPVFGQVVFSLLIVPVLERQGRTRVAEILRSSALDDSDVDPAEKISSVNDPAARNLLQALDPLVVVVVGTRIIASSTLDCVKAPFVNLHAGITPRYRGVHGGYWALAEGRPDLAGSTVHFVDPGIDTGLVLGQATFEVTPSDSFATYSFLHLAVGVPMLVGVVEDVIAGRELVGRPPLDGGASRLWYHPTCWGYISKRLRGHVA